MSSSYFVRHVKCSRKYHSMNINRKDSKRKRKPPKNRYEAKLESESTSSSAKKLKSCQDIKDKNIEYRILNFLTVFAAISQYVKCKKCGNNIEIKSKNIRGLGFDILIDCKSCNDILIPSCPKIGTAYEVNRRFVLAMRLLGIGLNGARKFCGIMDIPSPVAQTSYDSIVKHIHKSSHTICNLLFRKAINEEKEEMLKNVKDNECQGLIVSGDGTWRKRGFNSLFGVSSLIGHYTAKVFDVVIKSAYCKACEYWSSKTDTEEYDEWKTNHKCLANHVGSAGAMEVNAICEMFQRSMELYDVRYTNYIGDGDSKTYAKIVNSKPYGDVPILKKECIGHVQKRMGRRLRECRKNNKLGGRNKLTAKLIDKLTVYYGLAIRRNCESVEKMKNAIWATYYHYCSTNEKPQHHYCPQGVDSWCDWQRTYKTSPSMIKYFIHDYQPFDKDVAKALFPIYQDLSNSTLLERCVGGFMQNNNESFNSLIWHIAPKIFHSGAIIVEIATYIAACMYNEGINSILKIMHDMNIRCGRNAHQYAIAEDNRRHSNAELRARRSTKEARLEQKLNRAAADEKFQDAEDLVYGPGVDDSV